MDRLDPDQIYDPNQSKVPKLKPAFKITKEHRSGSCCSNKSMSEAHLSDHNADKYITNPLKGLLGDTVMN